MTLYRIVEPDWEEGGSYGVEAVEVSDMFSETGHLQVNPRNLYPSELASLSVLGIQLSLQIQERQKINERAMDELERIRDKIEAVREAREETAPNTPTETT